MKTIRFSADVNLIKELLAIEDIYDSVSYDGSPSLEECWLEGVWIILEEDNHIAGLANLIPLNNVLWTPHILIYKEHRGRDSVEWGHLVIAFMKEHLGAKKFLAFTPYLTAKRYAEKIGFTNIGVLSNSIRKDGELLNQFILELGEEQK